MKVGEYPSIQSKTCGIGKMYGQRDSDVQSRIVMGSDVELGEFPWMAVIISRTPSGDEYIENFCGGVLISDRMVLTAANCFYEYPRPTYIASVASVTYPVSLLTGYVRTSPS